MPPVPGLRELEGVWGTHEATSVKAIPRHLLVLGAGAAGVELGQALHRLGAEVALVEVGEHVLPRSRPRWAKRSGRPCAATAWRSWSACASPRRAATLRSYVLEFDDGGELRGDRLLVATGRRARVTGLGLESVGIEANEQGIPVDAQMRAGEGLWAIGDVTGVWPLTYVGEYQGDVVAANILGERRVANYEAVPRVVFTDPQAAAVGASDAPFQRDRPVSEVSRTATYTRAYAESNGFLTLLSDGERLTGAYALGPEAGEWLQQATLAVRARIPLDVLHDTIQPFPSFSEIYATAVKALRREITAARPADKEAVPAGRAVE